MKDRRSRTPGFARQACLVALSVVALGLAVPEGPAPAHADAGAPAFVDAGFETPQTGGFSYATTGSGWTFNDHGGIQHNGSAFSYSTAIAPEGAQTAFLQGTDGALGMMSQSLSFAAGTYSVGFLASRRGGQVQPVRVSVDGRTVGTYTPPDGTAFTAITTATFTLDAGTHTVGFAATDSSSDRTTFIDSVSISGGSPGQPVPAAPTGLTATAGNAQVGLSWAAVSDATSYSVYRGTSAGGEMGTPLATGVTAATYSDTGATNGTAYFYLVRAINTAGASGVSNEAGATPSAPTPGGGAAGGPAAFANPSFETPQISGFQYAGPAGASWTFNSSAGIQHNGSAFSYSTTIAPDGTQTAFLQGANGSLGAMSQSLSLAAGTYAIGFSAARRGGQVQPVQVSVDGTPVGTYTPPDSSAFATITTANVTVAAGSHTVSLAATDSSADRTTFVDSVTMTATTSGAGGGPGSGSGGGPGGGSPGGPAPLAPTGLTATAANGQVALSWSGSTGATSYSVFRGTSAGNEATAPVATGVTAAAFTDTGLTNATAYFYTVEALNASGASINSNEATATPMAPTTGGGGGGAGTAAFTNPSFETPQINGFQYSGPAGSGWTFNSSGGIQHNGSAFSYSTAIAPDGTQTAFLQGADGSLGTMSQSVSLSAGSYSIGFLAARRVGQVQPVRVSVDGTTVGTYTPSDGTAFTSVTTASFTVTAGAHTVLLAATDSSADLTTFIDSVILNSSTGGTGGGGSGGAQVPAAPTGLKATPGNAQVLLSWSASTAATGYSIFRGTSAGGEGASPIATGISTTSYTSTGLANGTTYFFTVVAVGTAGSSTNSNEAAATPSAPAGGNDIDLTGYQQTFADEFDTASVAATSPKRSSTWYAYPPYGPAGNYSASTWNVSSFSAGNGVLSDKAFKGSDPGTANNYWNSGNLSSVDPTAAGFSQKYGYFEARIKMPDSGTGAWPAFWLEGTAAIPGQSSGSIRHEEVDIAEWYGICDTPGQYQAVMQQASHNYDTDGSQNPPGADYLYQPQTPMPGGAYPWQGFHTYGVRIDPTHITWYIDGVQTNQVDTPTQFVTSPFYMMLDYGLGGGYPLDGMVEGSAMQVDWVRVYSLPGS